jgi:hypothetical protein
MTVVVVDRLEGVEVEVEQTDVAALTSPPPVRFFEPPGQRAPVHQTGQGVMDRGLPEFLLERSAFGEVDDLRDEVQGGTGVVADERDRQLRPDPAAGGVAEPALHPESSCDPARQRGS